MESSLDGVRTTAKPETTYKRTSFCYAFVVNLVA